MCTKPLLCAGALVAFGRTSVESLRAESSVHSPLKCYVTFILVTVSKRGKTHYMEMLSSVLNLQTKNLEWYIFFSVFRLKANISRTANDEII